MSMSGIEISPDISTLFNEMKLRSTHLWAVFKIKDKKEVVIYKTSDEPPTVKERSELKADYNNFRAEYCQREPAYILYDFNFVNKEGREIKKLAFLFWCPDNSDIGDKMIYASTKDTVKKAFTGLGLEFQGNNQNGLGMDFDNVIDEIERKA